MFSPETSLLGAQRVSTRNPRRRQRQESASIEPEQAPRKKRSRLSSDTFIPPTTAREYETVEADLNGHATSGANGGQKLLRLHDVPVREKKQSHKTSRSNKDGGSVSMAQTANYSVKQLPNLPEPIQVSDYHSSALPSTGQALAVTRTHAYVWDYTSTTATASSRVFDLPYPSKPTEPIPVGALVANGPSKEIGSVVVTATGKVTYWDNVEAPSAFSLFSPQQKYGVSGSVGGMLSGEKVLDLVYADHAGFVLIFSTGRLAHLTLRDTQSKPHINSQFLRVRVDESSGFFGGLKSAFATNSWRGNVAAVKVRPSVRRNYMNVITATADGAYHFWDINWSGQQEYKGAIDAKVELESAVQDSLWAEILDQDRGEIKVVDIAFNPDTTYSASKVARVGADEGFNVFVLIAHTLAATTQYALLDVIVTDSTVRVDRSIEIAAIGTLLSANAKTLQPTLILPDPGHMAVIVFKEFIALASIKAKEITPESQLLIETHAEGTAYQDVIYLRKDDNFHVLGCYDEESLGKRGESHMIMFVSCSGVLRLSLFNTGFEVTPKTSTQTYSKLEQAVFFGDKPRNPIDFNRPFENEQDMKKVHIAATTLSKDVLDSKSPFVIPYTVSMDEHFLFRKMALHNLIHYLQSNSIPITITTRWELLWRAEKLAAVTALWTLFGDRKTTAGPSGFTTLDLVLDMASESDNTNEELGARDQVRQWVTYYADRIHHTMGYAYDTIKAQNTLVTQDPDSNLILISDALDVSIAIHETAFTYRSEHLEEYGLENHSLDPAAPDANFQGLPEIWTSKLSTLRPIKLLQECARRAVIACESETEAVEAAVHIAREAPRLMRVIIQAQRERVKWMANSSNEQQRAASISVAADYEAWRSEETKALVQLELWDDAIKLAEESADMESLVQIIDDETTMHIPYLESLMEMSQSEIAEDDDPAMHIARMGQLIEYVRRFFSKFGWEWAGPYYSHIIGQGKLDAFIDEARANEKYATPFLRNNLAYAKLAWIYEILRPGDRPEFGPKSYADAGDFLAALAQGQEKNVWSAKVQANMAKLTFMAENERNKNSTLVRQGLANKFESMDREVKIMDIQDRVYAHVSPVIEGALDRMAEIELAMAEFAKRVIRLDLKAHARILQGGLEKLLRRERLPPLELVELLTLMDIRESEYQDTDISWEECGLALKVLSLAQLEDETVRKEWARLVWKRAMVKDQWKLVTATKGKADEEVNNTLGQTQLYDAFIACDQELLTRAPNLHSLPDALDCVGAGTEEDSIGPSNGDERLIRQWRSDNAADDRIHKGNIEHYQLGYWYQRAKELATADAADPTRVKPDAETSNWQDQEDAMKYLREIEAEIIKRPISQPNGHALLELEDGSLNGDAEEDEDETEEIEESEVTQYTDEDAEVQEHAFFGGRKRSVVNSVEPEDETVAQRSGAIDLTGEDDEDDEEDDYDDEDVEGDEGYDEEAYGNDGDSQALYEDADGNDEDSQALYADEDGDVEMED